jgi:hypothetical protein
LLPAQITSLNAPVVGINEVVLVAYGRSQDWLWKQNESQPTPQSQTPMGNPLFTLFIKSAGGERKEETEQERGDSLKACWVGKKERLGGVVGDYLWG